MINVSTISESSEKTIDSLSRQTEGESILFRYRIEMGVSAIRSNWPNSLDPRSAVDLADDDNISRRTLLDLSL